MRAARLNVRKNCTIGGAGRQEARVTRRSLQNTAVKIEIPGSASAIAANPICLHGTAVEKERASIGVFTQDQAGGVGDQSVIHIPRTVASDRTDNDVPAADLVDRTTGHINGPRAASRAP